MSFLSHCILKSSLIISLAIFSILPGRTQTVIDSCQNDLFVSYSFLPEVQFLFTNPDGELFYYNSLPDTVYSWKMDEINKDTLEVDIKLSDTFSMSAVIRVLACDSILLDFHDPRYANAEFRPYPIGATRFQHSSVEDSISSNDPKDKNQLSNYFFQNSWTMKSYGGEVDLIFLGEDSLYGYKGLLINRSYDQSGGWDLAETRFFDLTYYKGIVNITMTELGAGERHVFIVKRFYKDQLDTKFFYEDLNITIDSVSLIKHQSDKIFHDSIHKILISRVWKISNFDTNYTSTGRGYRPDIQNSRIIRRYHAFHLDYLNLNKNPITLDFRMDSTLIISQTDQSFKYNYKLNEKHGIIELTSDMDSFETTAAYIVIDEIASNQLRIKTESTTSIQVRSDQMYYHPSAPTFPVYKLTLTLE